jgi:uncharacterized phage-associated protein
MAVADKLIRLSLEDETPITPMKVQKLTYFCHAWMLGLGYGPLFQDAVESWQYGPVIRALYHALKGHGGDRITQPLLEQPAGFTEQEEKVIKVIWRQYGHLDGLRLSRMTHATGSPWEQTFKRERRSQIVHNHVIRDYYAALIEQRSTE